MGRGRAPCCDKSKVNRGPWSPVEDFTLISFIQNHGHPNWRSLPKQAGLLRCGKSCRLRWINYLRPDLKRGNFTIEEEETIIKLHQSLGNKWSKISSYLPGRTDNEIKNVWNTYLKKRLMIKKDRDDDETKQFSETSSPSSSSISFMPPCGNHDTQKGTKEGDEPKEASFSSSSVSSYASDYWDPNGFDMAMPQNELGTLFQVPCEIDDAVYEANNRSTLNSDGHDQVVIEVPFESDIDLWGMLDNLDTLQSNEYTETQEFEAWQDSDFGEDLQYDWEINQCRKWFKTLGKRAWTRSRQQVIHRRN